MGPYQPVSALIPKNCDREAATTKWVVFHLTQSEARTYDLPYSKLSTINITLQMWFRRQ